MKRRETERIPNLVLLAMLIGSQQEAAGPPVIPPLPFTGCFLVGAQTSIWQRCMPHVVALCVCVHCVTVLTRHRCACCRSTHPAMSAGLNHFGLQIEKAIRKTSFSLGDTQKHTQIERKGVGEREEGDSIAKCWP